ncbi:MAG: F0F1 ATP synthase subunit epsilon [Bacteroides sp.]|nr:F0F1 ATP synthase subunit epsilon [Bacteroides sp.]
MKHGLYLSILSPEGEIFSGEVESITLPGAMGAFTILPHHAPIVSSLVAGTIAYATAGELRKLDIQSGFVEMSDGKVSVCVES